MFKTCALSDAELDAETEDGSSDGIPDDFFGVKDEPKFDGSEPPLSQPNPALALEEALEEHMVGYEVRGLEKTVLFCLKKVLIPIPDL